MKKKDRVKMANCCPLYRERELPFAEGIHRSTGTVITTSGADREKAV